MKRFLPFQVLVVALAIALSACGEGEESTPGAPGGGQAQGQPGTHHLPLELRPRLRLVGLSEISEALEVERLEFEAELFVLPEDAEHVGDAVPIRFILDEDGARTELMERPLRLAGAGAYQVLVRVRPGVEGVSVAVGGALQSPEAPLERGKFDGIEEPAPSPSEPAPSPSEPAPSPSEPAPSPSEPAPSPSEPAPSPSDGADEPEPFAERAPRAEEAPNARGKVDEAFGDPGEMEAGGEPLFVRSRRSFEFYAGVVEVTDGDRELLVTWDVREWLRSVLSEPLGLETPIPISDPADEQPGFDDVPTNFRIDAR
jgi:hypothetical protein